tara:strand:+ start:28 stop:375 length:348 start_codon:yes stop_codon:yes gene_type:complete
MSTVYNNDEYFRGGTQQYACPEIFNNEIINDWRKTDIWSLGIIIFTILMNEFPWVRADTTHCSIFKDYYNLKEKSLFWVNYNIEPVYKKILLHSLDIDPNKRYNIDELQLLIDSV